MGQYHYTVNLTKREYLDPHKLGDGLKLVEQCGHSPGGINDALHLLLAASNGRGGGDFEPCEWVGRWAGDRIAVVGDYGEDKDLSPEDEASTIYSRCREHDPSNGEDKFAGRRFVDITDKIIPSLERAYEIVYVGNGWRDRISLFGDIEGLTSTHAKGFGRVAEINGKTYRVCDVIAALRTAVRKRGEKFTLSALEAAGLKRWNEEVYRG